MASDTEATLRVFGRRLLSAAKVPAAVIAIPIASVAATTLLMWPMMLAYAYQVGDLALVLSFNSDLPGAEWWVWATLAVYWFVVLPLLWAVGSTYLEVRGDDE